MASKGDVGGVEIKSLNLVLILGSVREERNGERVARYVSECLAAKGHKVHILDPQEIKLPLLQAPIHFRKPEDIPPVLSETNRKISEADGVVLVSCEYNRTAPPAMTNFLAHFPPASFKYKPTAVVTYSAGILSGVVCAQQLITLMNELGSPVVPQAVCIPTVHETRTPNGKTNNDHIVGGVKTLIGNLEWYADALRSQRERFPRI
ncbi:FMN-dependent NADPH-azoreductase-like [Convolutriloba macropyga]|uniref:FMN-dependent NADPH-azoreductase-like n=1 Tax=Convolutriloba macropyga TaxID=536237 RepID=UPI003F523EB1